MTNMNTVLESANYASQQTDRWAFFCALIIIGLIGYIVRRDDMRQRDALHIDYKEDRGRYEQSLQSICRDQNEVTKSVAVALNANTEVLCECKDELRYCRESREKA